MSNETLVKRMREGQLVAATEHLLVPLFEEEIQRLVVQLCVEFKNREYDFLPTVAQIAFLKDLIFKLEQRKRGGERAATQLKASFDDLGDI